MCVECGCGSSGKMPAKEHKGIAFSHRHDHGNDDTAPSKATPSGGTTGEDRRFSVEREILGRNNRLAEDNRAFFKEHGIIALNILSAPGSGKTTLLEQTILSLGGSLPLAVIEGDQETSRDADRIRSLGVPAVQVNTNAGCHLDAHQIAHSLEELSLSPGMLLIIENIGNLVCPALFDLGETSRVVLFSVTEGEDKPLKYPQIFRGADLVLLTKSDLLPHLDFDTAKAMNYLRSVNPSGEILPLSARSGEGMDRWVAWISAQREGAGAMSESPTRSGEAHGTPSGG